MRNGTKGIIEILKAVRDNSRHPKQIRLFSQLIRMVENNEVEHEEALVRARMIGFRKPDFDGDEIGGWDD